MKKIIPLIAALTFAVTLPVAAQVGGVAPASPATPGLPTPTTPGMDATKPLPVPQTGTTNPNRGSASGNGTVNGGAAGTLNNGTMPGGSASGDGTLNGSGSRNGVGVGGTVNGGANGTGTGTDTLKDLDNGKTRGMNGSLPDGTATGTSRDGSNLGVNGNATATGRSGTNSANGGRFDINTGTEMSMQSDLGLTAAQAKAVREYRDANGPITNASQLRSIKGMGPKTRARMQDRLRFDDASMGSNTTP